MTVRVQRKFDSRLRVIKYVLLFVWAAIAARLVWIQIIHRDKFAQAAESQQNVQIEIQPRRGAIYDCQNRVLAQDVDSYSFYVIPDKIVEKELAAQRLEAVTKCGGWLEKFKNHRRFLWVARKTTPEIQLAISRAGIPTLDSIVESRRVYPAGDLALAVLGRVDIDNKGISGIELQYDSLLSGKPGTALLKRYGKKRTFIFHDELYKKPENGLDIVLTLDLDLQQIVEQELKAGLENYGGISATAFFVRAGSGEIAACASIDSNGAPARRNRAIADMYEPGSTFKIVAVASALESGRFSPNTIVDVEGGKYRVDDRVIRDDHAYDKLTVEEIVVHSSNIGAAKLGLDLGDYTIYKMITDAGFVKKLAVDFPGEVSGQLQRPPWRDHYLANVCFGHGISATPMQMTMLYDAVTSGGKLTLPYFGKEVVYEDGSRRLLRNLPEGKQIMTPTTAALLRRFLREVVASGTAKRADSAIVELAGKTGTALKAIKNKGYDHSKSVASFVGYFPADFPDYVGIVVFDEPKKSRYGGEISAPVFRRIAERFSMLPGKLDKPVVKKSKAVIEKKAAPSKPKPDSLMGVMASLKVDKENNGQFTTPDLKGLTIRQALIYAREMGIACDFSGSGIVVEQSPSAGEPIEPGTIVRLRCKSD